jgi:hypothetical protein
MLVQLVLEPVGRAALFESNEEVPAVHDPQAEFDGTGGYETFRTAAQDIRPGRWVKIRGQGVFRVCSVGSVPDGLPPFCAVPRASAETEGWT